MEAAMSRTSARLALAMVLPILFVMIGTVEAQLLPNYFYETLFVGNGPGPFANEVAVMSAWSVGVPGVGEFPVQGIFADFNTSANPANAIHAAALDSSANGAIPNQFAPVGALVVAKNVGPMPGVNGFETYYLSAAGTEVNPTHLAHFGTQELLTPVPVSFLTPTASGNPVQAMDIANGIVPLGTVPLITDYVVTAEVIAGQIWLGTYAMTNQFGVPVAPFFVNSTNTVRPGPCQGLTTSNGKAGWNPRSRNDIVFVDGGNQVHAQWFEISAGAFPALLDAFTMFPGVPWQLPAQGTIAGIWPCQTPNIGNAHNIGISFLGAGGVANAFYILHDVGSPFPPGNWTTTLGGGFGGGPVCHIPTGLAFMGRSPSFWALVGAPPSGAQITGWFVANAPAVPGGVWTLEAIDAYGFRPGLYGFQYSPGFFPNGTPLSDPTAIGFFPIPGLQYQTGLVWVPETNGAIAQINYVSGVPQPPAAVPPWAVLSTFTHVISPGGNHPSVPPLPALPRLPWTPWPATQILPDQKTNSKADYGLFMPGY
jgi:hypothetical protein